MRVFVDSNIPMYAAGATHPNKAPSLKFFEMAHAGALQAVTSAEVLQEILHRYHRLGEDDLAVRIYELTAQLCAEIVPVTVADTDLCAQLIGVGSVRDALHVAVMRNNGIDTIATYDQGFDAFDVKRWPLAQGK